MKIIKLSVTILAVGLFLMACNSNQPQTATGDPLPYNGTIPLAEMTPGDDEYWAKDNFDLQRVGNLLERSNSPQEFETYLNDDDGLNNLDLNGDGYVDYISVDEFEDRGDGQRGLSLFSRFGPDLIQEIATIVFYRDDYNSPGARVLMTGNDQIYGDNYYYESNWVDRSLGLVTALFGNRDSYYRSPYYYDNYPNDYVLYEVVEPQFYRTRVERIYPQPVFVYTAAPIYITKIKIKSPHNGKWMNKVHAKLTKPNREQLEFKKNNPGKPAFVKVDKGNKGEKDAKADPSRSDKQPKDDRKTQGESAKPGKPDKADNPNAGKGQGEGKGGGQGKGKKP